jgi:glycine cleavage system regulatory protein
MVVFTIESNLTGGSKRTSEFAEAKHERRLHISADDKENVAGKLTGFIQKHKISILNVAGSRSSKEPTVAEFVMKTLDEAFGRPQ